MRQISADQMKMDLKTAEQTPAMFLPHGGQTNMGGYSGQAGTGYGYIGTGSQSAYSGYLPQNTGYSTGASPGMPGGYTGGMPGYAPPLQGQPQSQTGGSGAGLPWSWNSPGAPPPPPAQPVYVAQQTYGANPQPPGFTGLQNPYGSPPFPRAKPGPVIVLSPGAKTTLNSVALAVLLGTCIALGIIAVQHSYDNWQETGRVNGVNALMKEGALAYEKGDYTSAVIDFEQAQNSNPSEGQRKNISVNLAYSCVKRARASRAAGKLSDAKADYEKALAAMPDLNLAHAELAEVLQQMGDSTGAQEHRAESSDSTGGAGSKSLPAKLDVSTPPPTGNSAGTDPNQFIENQRRIARQLLDEGDQLDRNGDHEHARDRWTQAEEAAPGTPESKEANKRLYNESQLPDDSGLPGS
jgi:hypothetical protein